MNTPVNQTDKIKNLLGQGLSNQVVANATGVSPSYISQLLSDEQFASEVSALRVTQLTQTNNRDRSIDSLEDKILAKLEQTIDFIVKPRDLLTVFSVLNRAVRRGVPASESTTVHQQIVNIHVPAVPMSRFVKNNFGEVIEVEGQTLVTMPTHTLLQKLAKDAGMSADVEIEETKAQFQYQTRVTPTEANPTGLHFAHVKDNLENDTGRHPTTLEERERIRQLHQKHGAGANNRYREVAKHLPAVSFSAVRGSQESSS